MRRPFVNPTFGLALALVPAVLFAQAPAPAQQPPSQQPTTQQPAAETAKPAAPKLTFKSTAGMLLVQVKPAETAAFEEMVAKLKAGTATATDPQMKQQGEVK